MKGSVKTVALWLSLLVVIILSWHYAQVAKSKQELNIKFSAFMELVESGQVKEVAVTGSEVEGVLSGGGRFKTTVPAGYPDLWTLMLSRKIIVEYHDADKSGGFTGILIQAIPFLLLLLFWIYFMRKMSGGAGGNGAMSFGKSKAKLLNQQKDKKTFLDVAGVEEAKEELQEIIGFLKEPQKYQKLGGKIPKGVLLMGPPGTGKTLLAKGVAGEANVPFFTISGSEFVEMFVGVGASRVRDLFDQAKKNAPCIIFIDELDAVGRHRGTGLGGSHDEREQTLNQLLVEMDGFETNDGVILIAATNRPDVLDPALLRPGRFDRRVVVSRPDLAGRKEILKVHTRKVPLDPDVDTDVVAKGTTGFSGADIANLVNEAALMAAGKNKKLVTAEEFDLARDKVLMGAERKTMIIDDKDKRVTAYHEGGHALVAQILSEFTDPLHKVTIIPRGMALGVTQQLPDADKYSMTRNQIEAIIAVCMGGRIAEEIKGGSGNITTGAESDMRRAKKLARDMVCSWGMSSTLGPLTYGEDTGPVFLGKDMMHKNDYSEETAKQIDWETKEIVTKQFTRAKEILTKNKASLEAIAEALMKYETLDGKQIEEIIRANSVSAK